VVLENVKKTLPTLIFEISSRRFKWFNQKGLMIKSKKLLSFSLGTFQTKAVYMTNACLYINVVGCVCVCVCVQTC